MLWVIAVQVRMPNEKHAVNFLKNQDQQQTNQKNQTS